MTVKLYPLEEDKSAEEETPYTYRLAKINPMITSRYYENLIKMDSWMLDAWDLAIGVTDLETCISILKKALYKEDGIVEPDPKPEVELQEPTEACFNDVN